MSNLSSFNTIVSDIDNEAESILDHDYLDSPTHNISQSTINYTIDNFDSDTKTCNDTIHNTIDNPIEFNEPSLNNMRSTNLYKQFSAILINEHTFMTRYYEEIDNRQNINLKNAILELKLERSIEKECSIDFEKSISCVYLFLYNTYTLLIPPSYRSRKHAVEVFTTIFYDIFNVKGNPIKIEKFKNIYYLRQSRIRKTIDKKSSMSHDEISKINILKQFESCKTPVFFSTFFMNNWNTLQKDIPELCKIKRIERKRKKLYSFDSIKVLEGIENIKKYYKELNTSQFGQSYSFEKIINDIFIYFDHDLPIISWNNIEHKTNGLVWRELPFKRYAFFLGTTFLSDFDTLEEGIILWVQLNQLCMNLKLFGINKTLYHLLLLMSEVPSSKVPKPRGRLCKIANKIYSQIKNISIE